MKGDKYKHMTTASGLEVKNNPISLNIVTLSSYVGTYGPRRISLEDGTLFYRREGRLKMAAIPISENTFMFAEIDYFRIQFDKISAGQVYRLTGIYDDGSQDSNERSSGL